MIQLLFSFHKIMTATWLNWSFKWFFNNKSKWISESWFQIVKPYISDTFLFPAQYIDNTLPPESPYLYGLHPNAEIGFLTQTSEKLFRALLEMQPRDCAVCEGSGTTCEEKVKKTCHARKQTIMSFWSTIIKVSQLIVAYLNSDCFKTVGG